MNEHSRHNQEVPENELRGFLMDPRQAHGRGPECLSLAVMDRLALGESDAAEKQSAARHLEGCAACQTLSQSLQLDTDDFRATAHPAALAADALARAGQAGASSRSTWIRRLVPLLTAGALAVVFVARGPAPTSELADNATKGSFALAIYVLHAHDGDSAARGQLHLGEPLHPGDQIRFGLQSDEPGYALVLGVDRRGEISVYHHDGSKAAPLGSGRGDITPGAIELDETLGRETLIALRCRERITAEAAIAAVKKAGGEPALGLPCAVARYAIDKTTR